MLGVGKGAGVVRMESEILAITNYVFCSGKTLHLDRFWPELACCE